MSNTEVFPDGVRLRLSVTDSSLSLADEAAYCLQAKLDVATCDALFEQTFGSEGAVLTGSSGSDQRRKCRALALYYTSELLSERSIRAALVAALDSESLEQLSNVENEPSSYSLPPISRDSQIAALVESSWVPGSSFARSLSKALGLSRAFAGARNARSRNEYERVEGPLELPELHDYQVEISSKLRAFIEQERLRRCMVSLPTGSGKTRVVVSTLTESASFQEGRSRIIWVAQHDELCEQALMCFAQAWRAQRPGKRDLMIQRVWASSAGEIDWDADIIIGTPQSIGPRLSSAAVTGPTRETLAIVLDEAHETLGQQYRAIFTSADSTKVIGLSATPGHSDMQQHDRLVRLFDSNLIISDGLGESPIKTLQMRGFLSKTSLQEFRTNYTLTAELSNRTGELDYDQRVLERAGRSRQRNQALLDFLLMIDDERVLAFAASVHSARTIATAMMLHGRNSAVIDASTSSDQRRRTVRAFHAGEIQFLFNFGVLATGFDAPGVDMLVIGRPTLSPVLREQMLGRGLRGPNNGGTESCTIVWARDTNSDEMPAEPTGYVTFMRGWKKFNG